MLSPTIPGYVFFFNHVTTITHLKVKNKGIIEGLTKRGRRPHPIIASEVVLSRVIKKNEASKAYGPKSGQGPVVKIDVKINLNKINKEVYHE